MTDEQLRFPSPAIGDRARINDDKMQRKLRRQAGLDKLAEEAHFFLVSNDRTTKWSMNNGIERDFLRRLMDHVIDQREAVQQATTP